MARGSTSKPRKLSRKLVPVPPKVPGDLAISTGELTLAADRLVFDGYYLTWLGRSAARYTAFSGPADEGLRESIKDFGPTPQGKYTLNPARIEDFSENPDWGRHRVPLEPLAETVERMRTCFRLIRTNLYVHGGSETGTHGCIELNDDKEEEDFFSKLRAYGRLIELEVRYVGPRELKYEEPSCRY